MRPPLMRASFSASFSLAPTHSTTSKAAFASGRGSSSGGISPLLMELITSCQSSAVLPLRKSVPNSSMRKPAFAFLASWQE